MTQVLQKEAVSEKQSDIHEHGYVSDECGEFLPDEEYCEDEGPSLQAFVAFRRRSLQAADASSNAPAKAAPVAATVADTCPSTSVARGLRHSQVWRA